MLQERQEEAGRYRLVSVLVGNWAIGLMLIGCNIQIMYQQYLTITHQFIIWFIIRGCYGSFSIIMIGYSFLILLVLLPYVHSAFCKASGRNILDTNGNKIFLKGISLGNWLNAEGYMLNLDNISSFRLIDTAFSELLSQEKADKFWVDFQDNYITADDFKYIKSVGFNVIRLPFNYKLLMDENGENIEGGWKWLNFAITQCKNNNIYLVLDLHSAPGGQTGANIDDSYGYPFLYQSDNYRGMTINLWKRIADRYKNEEIILGYELLNEPISTQFNTTYFTPLLEPLYKEITQAIRSVDKNHIIILDGAVWASQFYSAFGPPFDSNLVYTFHKYWVDPTYNNIKEYIDFGNQYNVPIWMGESGENSIAWITTFRELLEEQNISWAFWPYKKFSADSCIRTITPPVHWQDMVNYIEGNRANLVEVAKNRPPFSKIKESFTDFINKIRFGANTPNPNYIKALGLKA